MVGVAVHSVVDVTETAPAEPSLEQPLAADEHARDVDARRLDRHCVSEPQAVTGLRLLFQC